MKANNKTLGVISLAWILISYGHWQRYWPTFFFFFKFPFRFISIFHHACNLFNIYQIKYAFSLIEGIGSKNESKGKWD